MIFDWIIHKAQSIKAARFGVPIACTAFSQLLIDASTRLDAAKPESPYGETGLLAADSLFICINSQATLLKGACLEHESGATSPIS